VIRRSMSGPSKRVDELEAHVRSLCSIYASESGSETEFADEVVVEYQFYGDRVNVVGELNRPIVTDVEQVLSEFDQEAFDLFLMTDDWT
jgi:hypothetical protein